MLLTYNSTVLAFQGGTGAANGLAGTFAGCCLADTAIQGRAGAVGARRGGAACQCGARADALTQGCALQGEGREELTRLTRYVCFNTCFCFGCQNDET